MGNIRLLKANEIECRIATINDRGLSLLLYKDARVDQKILDEVYGPLGWKRSHQVIDGNLYCTVEVYDEKHGHWVAKQDVGVSAFSEKEKSQASDAFKRSCVCWGVGRELYSAPFIWIPSSKVNIQQRGDKYYCNDFFKVYSIDYSDERAITALVIVNGNGQEVFNWKIKNLKMDDSEVTQLTGAQMDELYRELDRTGVQMETVKNRYNINKPEKMSPELYEKVMTALARTKSRQAA